MNFPRAEHLEEQFIYKEYLGYIFKLPRNKDLAYHSIELQEYYYWILAEIAYNQLIEIPKSTTSSTGFIKRVTQNTPDTASTQFGKWEINNDPEHTQPASRYIQLPEIKKQQRDKLISSALSKVYSINYNPVAQNNTFQYIEKIQTPN